MLERLLDGIKQEKIICKLKKSVELLNEDLAEMTEKYNDMEQLCEHYKEAAVELANEKREMRKEIARLKENDKKAGNV